MQGDTLQGNVTQWLNLETGKHGWEGMKGPQRAGYIPADLTAARLNGELTTSADQTST